MNPGLKTCKHEHDYQHKYVSKKKPVEIFEKKGAS